MNDLTRLRLRKLWISCTRPKCWKALRNGVTPAVEHKIIIETMQVDGVVDVGANRGQFTLLCRLILPEVKVIAFEPITSEAKTFRRVHGTYKNVKLLELALGDKTGVATLHLSQSPDSSSLLPIGKKQNELFSQTEEVGTITVPVKRRDDLQEHWTGRSRQLLKLDVQGFELNVLKGGVETLKSCSFVYAECSEVTLYDGQSLRPEVETFLHAHGFSRISRHNEQWDGQQLIQADYLFGKTGEN